MVNRNEGLTKHTIGFTLAPTIPLISFTSARFTPRWIPPFYALMAGMIWPIVPHQEFIEQDADEGKTPKTRLDWPAEFKDEVLARLLALNAERAAEGTRGRTDCRRG